MNELQNNPLESVVTNSLAVEVKQLIAQSQRQVAVQINSAMTLLYWNVGKRIKQEVLKDQRAEYGKQILINLSKELTLAFGKGWSEQQLRHCVRFVDVFVEEKILSTVWRELTWSHIKTFIYIDDTLKRRVFNLMYPFICWDMVPCYPD